MERAVARWRNASLRRRLLTWLLPAACVIGLVASAGTYWGALRELDDLLDVRAIASGLKRRNANNLEPVDVASMPNEVRPLAEAINDLLARLDRSFTLQRHFIADAAHELRTPIMGLSIQSQLLRRAATAEEREHILAQIHAGTTRLGHLAEQLLTLARLEPDAQAAVSASAPVDLA
ncbi:two-component sensor histidine kinase, partial [Burkholderia cenocepacia]|nr:two-component sensor histidine kinase [Burkholderia cenocepacia]MDR5670821.1 two-component sensor histidine kinase [Burkholderia cenocepacia]